MSSAKRANSERMNRVEALRLAKALIRHTSLPDGNHFDEEEQLYELADECSE